MDGQTPDPNATNAGDVQKPASTTPLIKTPLTDAVKKLISERDTQIADLKAQLNDAVANGTNLQAQIAARDATIADLHDAAADEAALATFLSQQG